MNIRFESDDATVDTGYTEMNGCPRVGETVALGEAFIGVCGVEGVWVVYDVTWFPNSPDADACCWVKELKP